MFICLIDAKFLSGNFIYATQWVCLYMSKNTVTCLSTENLNKIM